MTRRYTQEVLKPQDIVVLLKLSLVQGERPPYLQMANDLYLYPSEVYASIKRARESHRCKAELKDRLNRSALLEFLIHGIRYAFPASEGAATRGVPTSYAASPLKKSIAPGNEPPPVWPFAEGPVRGYAFSPLHKNVPKAALQDPRLYELLALVDALRDGKARERDLAARELSKRLEALPMSYPNLDLLERAAAMLQPLLPEIVFVGGCATGLLITDPGVAAVRRTYDVDVITEIASYADYVVLSDRLRELGFEEDSREGAPLCRWQYGDLVLDVMPLDAKILGFSNRWYADALRTSADVSLPGGLIIRAITAPYFLGTKFEAFRGRGQGDYFASHDLEDLVAVIDGRTSILQEVQEASPRLHRGRGSDAPRCASLPRCLTWISPPDAASQARIGDFGDAE